MRNKLTDSEFPPVVMINVLPSTVRHITLTSLGLKQFVCGIQTWSSANSKGQWSDAASFLTASRRSVGTEALRATTDRTRTRETEEGWSFQGGMGDVKWAILKWFLLHFIPLCSWSVLVCVIQTNTDIPLVTMKQTFPRKYPGSRYFREASADWKLSANKTIYITGWSVGQHSNYSR